MQTITYSNRFCRQFLDSSIVALKYLNDLLLRLSNLVTKFLFSCNNSGFYKENELTEQWMIETNDDFSEEIDECI